MSRTTMATWSIRLTPGVGITGTPSSIEELTTEFAEDTEAGKKNKYVAIRERRLSRSLHLADEPDTRRSRPPAQAYSSAVSVNVLTYRSWIAITILRRGGPAL